ncbi:MULTISPECIES: DUF1775 domain-containing protein [Streptomyces]|uniref:Membrane protein n=1 Tax=Streptomyces virginiae TaxID=1961 RepID=A0ABQ3NR95_STRVG|nr:MULTISPECIES: DUF1775 domain-containing protein [Streptomyces]KOU16931.1 hypothetical protein ADK49_17375 [Streptomyces sp. WM6349]KOU96676.1 hypothetical protein ADK92_16645 [Streptomyces sp. XY533]KOV13394.1 hypothetical protein ADK91_08940 [Streptomyces sp. XY511]KOV37914.1 hypothetical protein ADK98_35920 [Streptomyces sp. H036]MBP2348098.1 uncharacterized protein YcnI [Streptomyces virginiae]
MQISHDHLPLRRLGLAAAGSVVLLGIAAGPAAAHAEVSASDPRALAENVTLSFTSEAESDAAGIAELRVVLPQGIAPDAVTLKEAPEGWKLTATPDGYSVGGAALATGTDAEYSITVRQLPDAESLAFKTLETYGDGKVSRWIEVPADGRKVDNPAPLLKLQPAAPGAKPIAPSPSPTPTPTPSAPTAEPSSPAPAAAPDARKANAADSGSGNGVVVAVVAAVVVLGGAGAFRWTRRSRQS